ncbi:MAG: helix-turn-helix domain-containing protein [Spirochaetales bacterium]|nr:helix-turn-helix domain-containing protein [Spirochaetales bacterium]MDY5914167.1 helix-turn-helix domain-containing protein [Treponema sp.]
MKITDAASLGNAIRLRRKELKYTQGYISEITGLSISFLSDLENGKLTCEIGKTIEVINLLGLDILVEARGDE